MMGERMNICNMSIEAGARAGMIAPDDVTFEYLATRGDAPKECRWNESVRHWRSLRSDGGAGYDANTSLDASRLEPRMTYGRKRAMGTAARARVPAADPLAGHFALAQVNTGEIECDP